MPHEPLIWGCGPRPRSFWAGFGLFLSLAISCVPVSASDLSIDWHKLAGGGGTSSGGQFSVTSSIGQHDAGKPMSGGTYALTGGFLAAVLQAPGAPPLSIARAGASFVLSWSGPASGFTLQQTPALGQPSWTDVSQLPADIGGIRSVTVPLVPGGVFFRLKK